MEPYQGQTTDWAYCRAVLPKVSRTFALTISLLPAGVRRAVTVSYLLCRIADTIEDSTHHDRETKIALLKGFREALSGPEADAGFLEEEFAAVGDDDGALARHTNQVLREFFRLPPAQVAAIAPWVDEMCEGMAIHAAGPVTDGPGGGLSLGTMDELERYCYFVAGTVGRLLTDIFVLHDGDIGQDDSRRLGELSLRFGLGLQFTNIVRDRTADALRGVNYLPGGEGVGAGADREALLAVVDRAWGHLDRGLEYCTLLPARQYRIRVFCLVSLLLAARTLPLAAAGSAHPGAGPVKIGRSSVYRTLSVVLVAAPFDALARWSYRRFRPVTDGRAPQPVATGAAPRRRAVRS